MYNVNIHNAAQLNRSKHRTKNWNVFKARTSPKALCTHVKCFVGEYVVARWVGLGGAHSSHLKCYWIIHKWVYISNHLYPTKELRDLRVMTSDDVDSSRDAQQTIGDQDVLSVDSTYMYICHNNVGCVCVGRRYTYSNSQWAPQRPTT